ncbi:unnamed protein product, partial [Mesorhabditis spiculigera]
MDTSQASTNNSEAQKLIWDITTNRRHPVCQFFDCYDGYRKDCINRVAGRVACKRCAWEKTAQKAQPSTDVMAKHLAECHRKKHREFLQRMKTWKKVDNKKRINPLFSGAAHSDVPEIQAVPEKQPPQMNLAALDLYLGKPAATPNLTQDSMGPEMQSENIPDRTASSGLPFSRIGTAVPHRKFSQRKSRTASASFSSSTVRPAAVGVALQARTRASNARARKDLQSTSLAKKNKSFANALMKLNLSTVYFVRM